MAKVKATTAPNETEVAARNDAYTGMLAISLFALVAGCALLFLDLRRYEYPRTPPKPSASRPALPAPIPAQPGNQNPGNQNPGAKKNPKNKNP